ncbi:tigger transposable element-derived protein 6-like [Dermacentor silvarum]|uniref:tigger transposable element-derived protein 6-like n=1 Tax=Dermacentor silvarum TaxID=543639 RepID=UPI002100910C|nr:tigger transposable element-derived protein 6-like [Dermacentor silvarum]
MEVPDGFTASGKGMALRGKLLVAKKRQQMLRVRLPGRTSAFKRLSSLSPDDVFNGDETAFFYQLLPDKTMNFKGDKCKGGKKSRLHVSVLFCCNSTGTEKLKPLVIGKSAKPRCLKNVSLPSDYRANKKAGMTRELFTQWLLQLDDTMKKKDRKILIVDNCSAHIVNVRLSNVKLEYMPPNCTSLLQPLDQGIIRCVRTEFWKRLVQRLLINIRLKLPTQVNIRQAAEMLTWSWWNVKAGLLKASPTPQDCEDTQELNQELWDELTEKLPVDTAVTFDDYIDSDSVAATSAGAHQRRHCE